MLNKLTDIFLQPFQYHQKVELFRKVLYVFLFINTLLLLPAAHDLFAYYGTVGTRGWNTDLGFLEQGSYSFLNILSHPLNAKFEWLYILFIIGQLAALILGFLGKMPRLMSFAVYFFTVNLFSKGYLAFTGGEVLINFLLFYLMFIHPPREKEGFGADLQPIVNHVFFRIMLVQVCLLYFFSVFYKLLDAEWLSGDAIMYISRFDAYSTVWMQSMLEDNPTLSAFFTYTSLLYQALFPFVVWIKKVKKPFLLMGVVFHLGIAFGMGIFTFGIVMILVYLLFLDQESISTITKKLRLGKFIGSESL